jgi:hypothetical protein
MTLYYNDTMLQRSVPGIETMYHKCCTGATSVFSRDQMALTGKVGGMKDDIAICLQLAVFHTQQQVQLQQGLNR